MKLKTRFCPSPTGLMHLGNYRTALFSYLFAKCKNDKFVLRIEDTDRQRSDSTFARQLQNDLNAVGIQWDEGPCVSKDDEQYYQSKRGVIYQPLYDQLLEKKQVYYCFCSPEKLAQLKKQQQLAGQPPKYSGTCRSLTSSQIQAKFSQGQQASLRFMVSPAQIVDFNDLIRGHQIFNTSEIGDFIIRKTDGTPSFMFCNAVDDSLMNINYVIRGEDHLTNTPRQILVLRALSMLVPQYAHISIILGDDGQPLSKRNGSNSINNMLEQGFLPSAINNYLARLGNHSYSLRAEDNIFTLKELAKLFNINKLSKSAAKFDLEQLMFWQKKAVRQLNNTQLASWLQTTTEYVPSELHKPFNKMVQANIIFPHEALVWVKIIFTDLEIDLNNTSVTKEDSDFFNLCYAALQKHLSWQDFITSIKQDSFYTGKKLFYSIRLVLTGRLDGPSLQDIFVLIDQQILLDRFEHAINFSSSLASK